MVLCAGLGTRLRPLTERWPKPAIPLLGQPLLRYAFATLERAGVREVGINTFHLPEVMEAVAREEAARAGLTLEVVREAGEIQGTGGGIRGLKYFLDGDDFLVLNGDVLFGVDLKPLVEAHRRSDALATMVLLPMPQGETYNAVELDAEGHVRRIAGKGPGGPRLSPWHFSGVHLCSPRVFDFMAKAGPEDINKDVYVRALEAGSVVRGHIVTDAHVHWSDLGTPARYAQAHRELLFGQVAMTPWGLASPFSGVHPTQPGVWVQPGAKVADARIAGPAFVASGAVLGQGVRLGAGVSIGRGAKVGDGAQLNRVAVLDGAEVPAGQLLEDVLVGPGGVLVPTEDPAACA